MNVADASHSTYLTTIVCNAEFMHSLSKHDKENFLEAARRTSTINQITESLSKHEIEKLREPWAPLYEKYMNYFSFDIIDEIKKLVKYLKLKSMSSEDGSTQYNFWFDIEKKKLGNLIKKIEKITAESENISIQLYSRSGIYE